MKTRRLRNFQKAAKIYQIEFSFREPYQVLVETEFFQHSLKLRLNVKENICEAMGGAVKLMITPCMIQDMRNKGDDYLGAVVASKRLVRRNCQHKSSISPKECLLSVIGSENVHRYCLASHNKELNLAVNNIPAVPLFSFIKDTIILHPITNITKVKMTENEKNRLLPKLEEKKRLDKLLGINKQAEKESEVKISHKKKPKAPNPLSVKKKKIKSTVNGSNTATKKNELDDKTAKKDVDLKDLDQDSKNHSSLLDIQQNLKKNKRKRKKKKASNIDNIANKQTIEGIESSDIYMNQNLNDEPTSNEPSKKKKRSHRRKKANGNPHLSGINNNIESQND